MRIDAHQHFWTYDASQYAWIDDAMAALRRDFLPADSMRVMSDAGFDACVAVQARQTLDETRWLLALAEASPSIAGVVGWIDLQAGGDGVRTQLRGIGRHRKLVGVRHVVQSEPDDRFLLRPAVLEGIRALQEFDLAFDLLIYPRHLAIATEFVAAFPEHRFVLDHLAKPSIRTHAIDAWERDLRELAACPNMFAKLSGLITEADWRSWTAADIRPYLDVAFDAFGWQRLMIGSDWPVCTVAGTYSKTLAVVLDYVAARPADEQDAVLGGNALRFWRMTREEDRGARADRAAAALGSM